MNMRHDVNTLKSGNCSDPRRSVVRNLRKKDVSTVKEMDELSGFNVLEYLEGYVETDDDEAESCFGIFYEEELIGYCTLGYAHGAIDALTKPDDVLLSDVFIKKEWRHLRLGTMLIHEVTGKLHDDCYLTYLYDELKAFYKIFGFNQVNGKDNIMVKHA